jgi:hypothetical protein
MRLAAVGIGMLIMLSGSVTGGLAGHRAESSPTVTLKTSTPSPSSSGQPTPPSTSEPRRTSMTAVMNGTAAGRHEAGHCVGGRGDLPRGSAPREVARAVPKLSAFAVPPHVVRAIAATGYDMCTTASNHAVDQGFAGLGRTLDELDRAKIGHVGTARSKIEAERPTIFTTRQGVKIAVVAATFSLNGLPVPQGKPWAVQRLSARNPLGHAHPARAAGADIVIAAVHAGTEYSTREDAQQVALARALTAIV